jgi:cytoskeletal protein RodZ
MQNFTIKYVIAVLVILFVLAGAILVLWPDKQSSKQTAHKPTTTEATKPKSESSTSTQTPPSQSPPKSTTKPQTATPTETKKPTSSSQLADTGPGETVAMFVATSAVFAGGHWYMQRRNLLRD